MYYCRNQNAVVSGSSSRSAIELSVEPESIFTNAIPGEISRTVLAALSWLLDVIQLFKVKSKFHSCHSIPISIKVSFKTLIYSKQIHTCSVKRGRFDFALAYYTIVSWFHWYCNWHCIAVSTLTSDEHWVSCLHCTSFEHWHFHQFKCHNSSEGLLSRSSLHNLYLWVLFNII